MAGWGRSSRRELGMEEDMAFERADWAQLVCPENWPREPFSPRGFTGPQPGLSAAPGLPVHGATTRVSDSGQVCFMRSWKMNPSCGRSDRSASEEAMQRPRPRLPPCAALWGLALESAQQSPWLSGDQRPAPWGLPVGHSWHRGAGTQAVSAAWGSGPGALPHGSPSTQFSGGGE